MYPTQMYANIFCCLFKINEKKPSRVDIYFFSYCIYIYFYIVTTMHCFIHLITIYNSVSYEFVLLHFFCPIACN